MNTQSQMDQLGINAVLGVKLYDLFGLTPDDLHAPGRFNKLQDVISFLKQYPEDTQRFMVKKVVGTKNVDKLQYFHEYCDLMGKFSATENERKLLEQSKPNIPIKEYANLIAELKEKTSSLKEEMSLYEK